MWKWLLKSLEKIRCSFKSSCCKIEAHLNDTDNDWVADELRLSWEGYLWGLDGSITLCRFEKNGENTIATSIKEVREPIITKITDV